jgi:hypothetical protein
VGQSVDKLIGFFSFILVFTELRSSVRTPAYYSVYYPFFLADKVGGRDYVLCRSQDSAGIDIRVSLTRKILVPGQLEIAWQRYSRLNSGWHWAYNRQLAKANSSRRVLMASARLLLSKDY